MATKVCCFSSHARTIPFISLRSPARTAAVRTLCTTTTATATILSYGPSLHKGHAPAPLRLPEHSPSSPSLTVTYLDESSFAREFDISALRVPAQLCSTLESRLRGHLLNWPRVRNIARVPGDEIDPQFESLIPSPANGDEDEEESKLISLNRRIYGKAEHDGEPLSGVLYRDSLAKTFNSRGYANFRNLAKISRPKKKKKKKKSNKDGDDDVVKQKVSENEVYTVEVVESEMESGAEDLSGLLGEDFVAMNRKWMGSTRLLLLDERYTGKGVENLPEAIQAVIREYEDQPTRSAFEIVKCKLTLFYGYWQLSEILGALLPRGTIIPSAFEIVGHIAHLNLSEEHLQYKYLIAKVVLDKNKPKIQTVVNKVDAIQNEYRTMQLEVLAGNNSLVTTVVENGLRFHVDLAKVYWNSRLATERQRLLSCFTASDVVCDVFAGVGPISLAAAKEVKRVYANDLNPIAVEYLERNCVLNKLERKVEVFKMDGRRFIETVLANEGARPITQVVMNLPKDAAEFLDVFRGIFQDIHPDKDRTLPRIHVYGFSKASDPEYDFLERIRTVLEEEAFDVEMHRVRLVAPGKWMLCASFILPERVAYAETGSSS